MTYEDVFFKAAADRFEEVKMAGWGDLVKALRSGYSAPAAGAKLTERLRGAATSAGEAWRKLEDPVRKTLAIQAAAVPLGAVAGYNMAGDYDENGRPVGMGSRLLGAGMGALGGVGLGHVAGAPLSEGLKAWSGK